MSLEQAADVYSRLPDFSGARLSPNGQSLAYSLEYEGKRHLIFQKMNGEGRAMIPPPFEGSNIDTFHWANDAVLLITVGFSLDRWEFRSKTYETRTIAFNTQTKEHIWLGKPKKQRRMAAGSQYASQHERLVDFLPDDPDHVLMEFDFNLDGATEVYKVDVNTGVRRAVKGSKKGVQRWYTDTTSDVRLGYGYDRTQRVAIYKGTDGKWIDLKDTDWFDHFDIEGFAPEPNTLYVSGRTNSGKAGLFKLDVLTGKITEPVFAHDDVDLDYIVTHPLTGQLSGVAYTDDFSRITYFDKKLSLIQRSLEHALPGKVISISGQAHRREFYLILAESDLNSGDYYIYDRDNKNLEFIASARPQLREDTAAPTLAVTIPVRDGASIPAYVTVPNGMEATGLPAIVLPHGGPQARDSAEWDYWAQFYAAQGYLVLKPNFRGSTGYGYAFEHKGEKQWGGLMQDDVTDATKWLIAEGMADPNRICIVGASYGGYAALMGAIKEPKLYKCAISVNGVTDLPGLKAEDKNFIGGRVWIKHMGLEGTKDEDVSPYDRADEINIPVLIMSSKDDMRIPHRFSKSMHNRLEEKGKNSRYVEIEDGGHSMVTRAARQTLLLETGKFLREQLGPE